ncbi:unnamed protein product [Vitrella brassicaformis CCMP3155]|uniref:Uncharacterized protein n=1 Tax=Vitrella brassicaformis (strain CCMP3155) TaxID=1169540 RepID=A0A0G4GIW6_VITBC|nr:unnamed protein product [Vitrella brassicaformis CCMP3155]|eukprot:CEM29776.1 unnamed protein product [Vitrella brassicaformis CCMP3155]
MHLLLLIYRRTGPPKSNPNMVSWLFVLCGLAVIGTALAEDAFKKSPISPVVELLEHLATKIDNDGKAEQRLFKKYECWCDDVTAKKEEAIKDNTARVEELAGLIDDLTAGRTILTTEGEDLKEEEEQAYLQNKAEMEAAIQALQSAMATLSNATTPSVQLLAMEAGMHANDQHTHEASSKLRMLRHRLMVSKFDLRHVLDIGRKYLRANEVRVFENFLNRAEPQLEDIPQPDWKLNKASPFRKAYEAGSTTVQQTLASMLDAFQKNLDETNQKETDATTLFIELKAAKEEEISSLQEQQNAQRLEGAARAKKLVEYNKEKEELSAQIEADTQLLADVRRDSQTKNTEFNQRVELREAELQSVRKAIQMLHSDDSRDLFSKTMKRHEGQVLLQLKERVRPVSLAEEVKRSVVDNLTRIARRLHNAKLIQLVHQLEGDRDAPLMVNGTDPFVLVKDVINKEIANLQQEEKDDISWKEQCKADIANKDAEARESSQTLDDLTGEIERIRKSQADLIQHIKTISQTIADVKESRQKATTQREAERTEFTQNQHDDLDAIALLAGAAETLRGFYEANSLEFALVEEGHVRTHAHTATLQLHRSKATTGTMRTNKRRRLQLYGTQKASPNQLERDAAISPPPVLWTGPYTGSSGESGGIVAVLNMIKTDLESDLEKAREDETTAESEYQQYMADSDTDIQTLDGERTTAQGTHGELELDASNKMGERSAEQEDLDAVLAYLEEIKPHCDFILDNFDKRLEARRIESDGLKKALAFLNGMQAGGGQPEG